MISRNGSPVCFNREGKNKKGRNMKKRTKSKVSLETPQVEADVTGLIIKMQEQLSFLEKKIDTLISQSSERPVERMEQPKPFQRFDHPHRQGETRHDNSFRDRTLHRAICADCKKECEVPFKPSGERPVYCKDCFSKRKGGGGGGSFNERSGNRPRRREFGHERHFDRHEGGGNQRPFDKKRRMSKKRKK
jgi:CxxC-x17-CxxC domain-containing protein